MGIQLTDESILRVRMLAAEKELEAATIRLQIAHREKEFTDRTLEMSEAVARSMMEREGIGA